MEIFNMNFNKSSFPLFWQISDLKNHTGRDKPTVIT